MPLAAAPRVIRRTAEVDRARTAGERHLDRPVDVVGDAERAREVPAGPAGDHRELDVVALRDAVCHLVHGPVAAHDDQQLGATVGRVAGQLRELAGAA